MSEKYEMQKKIYDAMELMRKRYTTGTEEYFSRLKEYGIELSEEKIIEDYEKVLDIETLEQKYYDQYGKILDDKQEEKWLNSDVFMELMDRVLSDRFDAEETGDPYFINRLIDDLCVQDPKKINQKDVEKLLRAFIKLSKTRNMHILEDTLYMPDVNGLLRELIRVCHDRTPAFKALVREMYRCYEDMDPRIFPSVYKEYSKH